MINELEVRIYSDESQGECVWCRKNANLIWLKWKIVNLLGVFDCFGMVLCRRMVSLNEVQVHSGVVDVEDAGSGGGDMALDDRSERRSLDLEQTIYMCVLLT